MTLSADNKKFLDELRDRIKRKHVEYNEEDLLKLSSVYGQVLEFSGIKGGAKIDKSCSSCIMEAVKILFNYITYHEPITIVHRPTIVNEVKPIVEYGTDNRYPEALANIPKPQENKIATTFDSKETTITNLSTADKTVVSNEKPQGPFSAEPPVTVDPYSKVPDFKHTPEPPVKKTRKPRTVKPKTK